MPSVWGSGEIPTPKAPERFEMKGMQMTGLAEPAQASPLSGQVSPTRFAGDRGSIGRARMRAAGRHVLPLALVLVLGYLVIAPLVRLQLLALEKDGKGYRTALHSPELGNTIRTTVALALGSLAIALVLGTVLAWMSTQLPPRLNWMAMLPVLPVVLPPVAGVIGWAMLLSPRSGVLNQAIRGLPFYPKSAGLPSGPINVYTVPWIIILTGLSLTSFVYVFLRAGLQRINYELIEAARSSGAGRYRAFVGVVLPLMRPSLIYGTAVALLLGLGQFTAPLLLGTNENIRVLTTDVYRFTDNSPVDYGASAAVASPLLFAGLVVVAVQKTLLSNQQRFVSDVGKGSRIVGRSSKGAAVAIGCYSFLSTMLPLLALVAVSLSPYWSGKIKPSVWTFDNFRAVFQTPQTSAGIRTSLIVAITAVAISLPIGYLIAEVLHHRRGSKLARGLLEVIVSLPLGVPAVVFGAGFLFTYTQGPFVLYGTYWVLIIVYVTLMLPFATRMQLAARMSLGESYEAASRISGAGVIRTHLNVVLPMTRGAVSGSAALMFVLLSHEFAASLLVRSAQTQVMGTVFYDYWVNASFPMVAAMGLLMALITALGVGLALAFGGRSTSTT